MERWKSLSKSDCLEIKQHLSFLPVVEGNDESARRFDYLTLTIQLCMLEKLDDTSYINQVVAIAKGLSKKSNIPMVEQQMPLINNIQHENFWLNRTLSTMENLRVALRDLIKFLEYEEKINVYTSFEDDLDTENMQVRDLFEGYRSTKGYKDRVEKYIRDHKDHLVIHKLKNNIPITKDELTILESILFSKDVCGSKIEFKENYGDQPLGTFIRSIIGLEIKAVNEAFAEFLSAGNLEANQMTFIQNIIQYLTRNGVIEKEMFFESPFTEQHQDGILGLFDDTQATRIISIVDRITSNAGTN